MAPCRRDLLHPQLAVPERSLRVRACCHQLRDAAMEVMIVRVKDEDSSERFAFAIVLLKLLAKLLAGPCAAAVIARLLDHPDRNMRRFAMRMLSLLEPSDLAPHAAAIAQRLDHSDRDVRRFAMWGVARARTLGCGATRSRPCSEA